jgi:YfiH family protein
VSKAPWTTFNLGDHVGDDPSHVQRNRQLLGLRLGARPVFLKQVHGMNISDVHPDSPDGLSADACWTSEVGTACTIMVADCLPLLITNEQGQWVAAAHAGWRGLAGHQGQGVVEAIVNRCMRADAQHPSELRVWLGPCIGPAAFEVGPEVHEAFCTTHIEDARAFALQATGRYLADLALLARLRLERLGVQAVYGNDSSSAWCTHTQESLFFSHRRDAGLLGSTGRMAACIWLDH